MKIFPNRETKQLIREAILLSVDAIKDDITNDADPDANKTRAEAIKTLTEAFKNMKQEEYPMKANKRKTRHQSIVKRIKKALSAERGDAPGKPIGFYPRHLARSVAKANMRRAGIRHINRNFADNWKKWVTR